MFGKKPKESVSTKLIEGSKKVMDAARAGTTVGDGLSGLFSKPENQQRVRDIAKGLAVVAAVAETAWDFYKDLKS